jgi:hypothetical protein
MFYILYLYDASKYTQWFEIKYNTFSSKLTFGLEDNHFSYTNIESNNIHNIDKTLKKQIAQQISKKENDSI